MALKPVDQPRLQHLARPVLDRSNPLGRIVEDVWVPTDLSGVAIGKGTKAAPHADVRIGMRGARLAFTNTDANESGGSATIPALAFPWVQFAQFYVDAAPGFVPTQPALLSGSFAYSLIQCGSSSFMSALVRFQGTPRSLDITVSGGTFGKLLTAVLLVKSETDQVLYCNGQSATNTSSPGSVPGAIVTASSPAGYVNGATLLSGYGRGLIPDDYALWLTKNPDGMLDVFEPRRIWVPVSAAGGATSLTLSDAAHAHTADSLTLTTSTTLAIADATHGHSADGLGLTTAADLAVQDATHAHAADAPALSTDSTLAIADASHAHAADNLTLEALTGTTLVIQDAAHAHASDAPDLTLQSWLAIADAWHAHAADSLTLEAPSGATVIGSRAGRASPGHPARPATGQSARRSNVQTATRR